jgi:hypothetical protein
MRFFLIGRKDLRNVVRPMVTSLKECCSCKGNPKRNITHSRARGSSPWHAPSSPARTGVSSGSLSCSAPPACRPAHLAPGNRQRAPLPVHAHLSLQHGHGPDSTRLATGVRLTLSAVFKTRDESVMWRTLPARNALSRVSARIMRGRTRRGAAEVGHPQTRPPGATSNGEAGRKAMISQSRGKRSVEVLIMTTCLNLSANIA